MKLQSFFWPLKQHASGMKYKDRSYLTHYKFQMIKFNNLLSKSYFNNFSEKYFLHHMENQPHRMLYKYIYIFHYFKILESCSIFLQLHNELLQTSWHNAKALVKTLGYEFRKSRCIASLHDDHHRLMQMGKDQKLSAHCPIG